jgi:hypothetical protein
MFLLLSKELVYGRPVNAAAARKAPDARLEVWDVRPG